MWAHTNVQSWHPVNSIILLFIYQKSQLAELLRQTGDVGSSLGSLSAFVSYYEHKHTKCSEHGDEFQKEAASVVLELCNFVEFVGEGISPGLTPFPVINYSSSFHFSQSLGE